MRPWRHCTRCPATPPPLVCVGATLGVTLRHLRVTGTSRVRFREMALRGELPGIVKSSW